MRSPSPRTREFMESVGSSACADSTSVAASAAAAGSHSSSSSSSSSFTAVASAATAAAEDGSKEKQDVPEAEYLNSRCVLFTYYQGDISSVVDEHFSRALSSFMEGEGKRRAADAGAGESRTGGQVRGAGEEVGMGRMGLETSGKTS